MKTAVAEEHFKRVGTERWVSASTSVLEVGALVRCRCLGGRGGPWLSLWPSQHLTFFHSSPALHVSCIYVYTHTQSKIVSQTLANDSISSKFC